MDEYLANAKAKGPKKRKRTGQYTNADPSSSSCVQRISRLNYGVKVPDLGVRPELAIERS